jgi:hypothetical protein
MRSIKLALLAGFALMVVALALTLSGSPSTVAASNRMPGRETGLGETTTGTRYCQAGEVLPRGSSAIRIWLSAAAGPRVNVVVYDGARAIAGGTRPSIWIGGAVTVPIAPLPYTVVGTTVCVSFRLHDETIEFQGMPSSAAAAAHDGRRSLGGRLIIDYLRPGTSSWLSLAGAVAYRMGLGRAAAGTWVVYLVLALLAAAVALASGLLVGELR